MSRPLPRGSVRFLVIAAAFVVFSLPIQNGGIGPFFVDLSEITGLSETGLAVLLAIATVLAAPLMCLPVRYLSRLGLKVYSVGNMILLAVGMALLSQLPRVNELSAGFSIIFLAFLFVVLRLVGQGGCNLLCNEILARFFHDAPGKASIVVNLLIAAAFVAAPGILAEMELRLSFEVAWLILAMIVLIGGVGCSFFLGNREPLTEQIQIDSRVTPGEDSVFTIASWAATLMLFEVSFAVSGVGILGASLGEWKGMKPVEYFRLFWWMMPFQLGACILCGRMIEARRLRWCYLQLVGGAALGLLGLSFLSFAFGKALFVVGFACSLGALGPLHTVSAFILAGKDARLRDRFNGRIIMGATIGGALGPVIFSFARDLSGTFTPVITAMICLLVGCLFLARKIPNEIEGGAR